MKERVKVKMEKQVKKTSLELTNRTKPERRLVSDLKHLSFATNLMVLANKALEEDQSLPAVIEKDNYEQAASQRDLVIQQKAKSLSTSHKATKALKEAKLNRSLELYKTYKKRVNESGLGACRRLVGNNLCGTLKELSFDDLVVLANAASIACSREVSQANESKKVVVPVGVEEHKCKHRVSGDMDCGGSCLGLSEELRRNGDLMQQRGKAGPVVSGVEEVKPNRDPSDGCREDKLFKKKYVRRKRGKNQDHLDSSTSVGAVAGTSNLVKELCRHKPSSLIDVDATEREEELLCHNGETQSKSEQGCCMGIKNKTKSKAESGTEAEVTAAAVSGKKQSDCLYSAWERGYPKGKRSQLIRQPKEPKKKLDKSREGKEQLCDQIDTCDVSEHEKEDVCDQTDTCDVSELEKEDVCDQTGTCDVSEHEKEDVCDQTDTCDVSKQEAKTEEKDVSDASNSSSDNPWSSFFLNVQWSNKKKRNCMKLEERQRNGKILVLAVEAITHQLCRLDISM